MWEGHSRPWEHHGVRQHMGCGHPQTALALTVLTVLGEAEETREIGRSRRRGSYVLSRGV